MREMIAVSICLLLFLIALQSGLIHTGLDYDGVKKNNESLQTANERLANEIKTFNNLAGKLFGASNSPTAQALEAAAPLKRMQVFQTVEEALNERLAPEVKNGKVQVENTAVGLKITLANAGLFSGETAALSPVGRRVLQLVGRQIVPLTETEILVGGHASNQPLTAGLAKRYATADAYSFARASAVAEVFQKEGGIDPVQLTVAGFGASRPVCANDSEDHRIQNERIEVVLRPADEDALKKARDIQAKEMPAPLPVMETPAAVAEKPKLKSKPKKKNPKTEAIGEEELQGEDGNNFDAGYEKPAE
jgi:chemotaxis protein MotB